MLIRHGKLELYDVLDSDQELEIVMDQPGSDAQTVWIGKDEAQQIVDHLTKVFNLKGTTP